MTEGTAKLPFFASDNPPDISSSEFNFTIVAYVQPPVLIERESDLKAAIEKRQIEDDSYRRSVSPTSWHRFTTLGFQATNGKDFEKVWRQRQSNPLDFHRLVWFNYKSYVDRESNVNPKLHAWATSVSQPFLLEHSPESLEMDTEHYNWLNIQAYFTKHLDKGLWKEVRGANKRNANKSSPVSSPTNLPDTEASDTPSKTTRFSTNFDDGTIEEGIHDTQSPEPETGSPQMGNIPNSHGDLDMGSESDAKQSAFTLSNEVMTNDGTHRISFKWKLSQKEFNEIVDDKQRLISELHSMLGIVFLDTDGLFYMWDGEDLVNPKRVNDLTISDLKDYMEPQVTKVHTMHLIVFAVRFAFTENPISWRNSDHAQEAMKLNNLRIQESNINTIAGIPIVAGYILLKHPTMTLRHKYTQFLRSQAADTLPYFDIRLHRKTPTDKSIAHLVVYCGETQVTELCQGLSKILNGQQTAVFLPRYTFANMSKDQIDNHFGMHDTYVRALRPISLAPLVTTLDLKRIEYFSDGTTIERSTRDWVSSLMRTDGTTHAQCDVVNGTKNVRIAYVMAPAAYAPEIREMVTQYKERLRPISHREAKYREGIPDLPDVIHITSTVQTNLDYMAKLSSSDIWSKAPSSVKSPSSAAGSPNVARRPTQSGGSTHSEDRTQWPSLVKRPGGTNASSSITSERQSGGKSQFKEKSTSQAAPREKISQTSLNSAENDERAETVSTHSLTNTLRTSATTRMTELENQMRECRELLRSNREAARDSSERLVATEQGLRETMETITEMTHTVAALQTQFAGFNITMESMRLMLHTLMHQQSNNTTPQYAALPYTAFHPPPATIPLVTIPESSHTATMSMESEEENQSTTSEGSKYRQSPEKKKTRKHEDHRNPNRTIPQTDLADVQMQLFDESSPDGLQDAIVGNQYSTTDQLPGSTARQSQSSPTTQQTSSPPDAQYTLPRDPAGQEDT